jgi:hypothetical protein
MSGYDITAISVAIIGSIASSGLFSYYWNKKLQRLQLSLDIKKSHFSARLEYEYEARKRLYLECEPILFQLHQLLNTLENVTT